MTIKKRRHTALYAIAAGVLAVSSGCGTGNCSGRLQGMAGDQSENPETDKEVKSEAADRSESGSESGGTSEGENGAEISGASGAETGSQPENSGSSTGSQRSASGDSNFQSSGSGSSRSQSSGSGSSNSLGSGAGTGNSGTTAPAPSETGIATSETGAGSSETAAGSSAAAAAPSETSSVPPETAGPRNIEPPPPGASASAICEYIALSGDRSYHIVPGIDADAAAAAVLSGINSVRAFPAANDPGAKEGAAESSYVMASLNAAGHRYFISDEGVVWASSYAETLGGGSFREAAGSENGTAGADDFRLLGVYFAAEHTPALKTDGHVGVSVLYDPDCPVQLMDSGFGAVTAYGQWFISAWGFEN